ncbi:phosphoenolpyruvate carboxykinase [Ligilactobacillus salivarius]|uniref:phosphoenolpyruvate carboxykinase (ATP) n=2 Tax=Bacilli TaxID=91061 RepID=A0AB36MF84_9LACO|nr:phosphoenolpyruvate carboxykinase (ATP) [Ligilactobacillus salivarius]OUN16810.1 phosphoenolpyruvate carboxykinase [Ligilactobacillus salivarius]
MSTISHYKEVDINKKNPLLSQIRTTVETAFYGNNFERVTDISKAYYLAKNCPSTIVTDVPIKHTQELGLPIDSKMLVNNHGKIVGRTAAARHIIGHLGKDTNELAGVLRDAIFEASDRKFYKTEVYVGLDEDFMLKSHLAVPKGYEFNMLSYMLNFQPVTSEYEKMYQASHKYKEGDIFIYADPEFKDENYPNGLVIIDAEHNVAAILGLRYFGELKKATLTLAWAIAHRHGYTASHGGEKVFRFDDKDDKVFAFYGLSGSGKSTLTHAKHGGKYDIDVLHDDAFVISRINGSSVALEPAYFDKTNDYMPGSKEASYFTTVMNVGVTLNEENKRVLVTEDLRNGNGRTIKSRYASLNRVDKENSPIDSIFWIMKDDSLPPVVKLDNPTLAATFGITLATKRSTAENVVNTDRNSLVIEPFANPFRAYPLAEDYRDFKELFEKRNVSGYIVNTASYNGVDIDKEITLQILEDIANEKVNWEKFGSLDGMYYLPFEKYPVDFKDKSYTKKLKRRLEIRLEWIEKYEGNHPNNPLPVEIKDCLSNLINELN